MPFHFLEEVPTADVGFVARGATLDECFTAAADATLRAMLANPDALQARVERRIHVDSDVLDLALLRFLEELVFYKDAHGEFLRARAVHVLQTEAHWTVDAILEGESIDPARHELGGDVKAVTLYRLQVRATDEGYEATVVLDV